MRTAWILPLCASLLMASPAARAARPDVPLVTESDVVQTAARAEPENSDEAEGVLGQIKAVQKKYYPYWFGAELSPVMEEKKLILLGLNFFLPMVFSITGIMFLDFWTPLLLLGDEAPSLDLLELLPVYAMYSLAGSVLLIGYLILGLVFPPYLGLFIWMVPYYAASLVLRWTYHVAMINAWDRIIKKQGGGGSGGAKQPAASGKVKRSKPNTNVFDEDEE